MQHSVYVLLRIPLPRTLVNGAGWRYEKSSRGEQTVPSRLAYVRSIASVVLYAKEGLAMSTVRAGVGMGILLGLVLSALL